MSRYWTGTVSANWSEPANWEPAGVPTAADDLEFPGWTARRNLNFDLPAGTSVGRMSFLADYSISGNTMTLTRDLSFVSDPSTVPVTFNNDLSIGATVRFYGPYRVEINGAIYVSGQTLRMGRPSTRCCTDRSMDTGRSSSILAASRSSAAAVTPA